MALATGRRAEKGSHGELISALAHQAVVGRLRVEHVMGPQMGYQFKSCFSQQNGFAASLFSPPECELLKPSNHIFSV